MCKETLQNLLQKVHDALHEVMDFVDSCDDEEEATLAKEDKEDDGPRPAVCPTYPE